MNNGERQFLFKLGIVIAPLIPASVVANDTFVYDNGSSVYPINTNKIRMVSEKITVVMEGKNFRRTAHVTCNFLFENTTSTNVKAKIGFPAEDRYYLDRSEGEKINPPLCNFISYIEGKKVATDVKVQEVPDSLAAI